MFIGHFDCELIRNECRKSELLVIVIITSCRETGGFVKDVATGLVILSNLLDFLAIYLPLGLPLGGAEISDKRPWKTTSTIMTMKKQENPSRKCGNSLNDPWFDEISRQVKSRSQTTPDKRNLQVQVKCIGQRQVKRQVEVLK